MSDWSGAGEPGDARPPKPVYEIPVTDPAAPPFGVPGHAGAMPPRRGESPPGLSEAMPVDFARLPPPSIDAAGDPPAPMFPPAGERPAPPAPPAPPAWPASPTTASPQPQPTTAPPQPTSPPQRLADPGPPPGPPAAATPAPVEDELARVARASVDPELLAALHAVLAEGASDLHISSGAPPLLRIDGGLRPVPGLAAWDRDKVVSALYSIVTPEQRAQFEEVLELDFAFSLSQDARFRVNFYQQRGAVGAALRLIPTEIKRLDQLGIPESVARFAKLPRGLVLVTGPTGSGKSTTLAALIDLVNSTRSDHIVTVEDPIEFLHGNKRSLVNQREVGDDTHSFANALKHVLRQDPDVILIGELRDLETISTALTAAETGHLVFATLHTQDAAQTVDRVIDVFPPHQQGQVRAQLAATLQGVVCQTLVKRASGSGRAVATEVLVTTAAIANLIREGKTYQMASAMQAGRELGMHTMDQALAELVNAGTVTHEAAIEKVHDPEGFKRLVHRAPPTNGMGQGGIDFGDSFSETPG